MNLPAHARVRAARGFAADLEQVYRFFVEQDAHSAARRYRQLQQRLQEVRMLLASNPQSGRPARFLDSLSQQGRLRAQHVLQLARQAGLPHLREWAVGRHVMLYAHSDTEVMLLALKHERQLTYPFASDTE